MVEVELKLSENEEELLNDLHGGEDSTKRRRLDQSQFSAYSLRSKVETKKMMSQTTSKINTSKLLEKQVRKQKEREFKAPLDHKMLSSETFENASDFGFGSYNTRNFAVYSKLNNEVVTRN